MARLLFVLTLLCASTVMASLPAVDLSPLPAPVRQAIESAYEDAQAILDDENVSSRLRAAAYGRVGDVLLAHGLAGQAREVYLQAQAAAPQVLDWPYSLAAFHYF